MISKADFAPIAALDFSAIKAKLMHRTGKAWSLERVNAVECEYRRFLFLMKMFPGEPTAPLADVDSFWHCHILDTMKYARDCRQVFGYFLHHFPYVGMRGEADEAALQRMSERMQEVYEATFEETYPGRDVGRQVQPDTAYTARVPAGPAYCGGTVTAVPAFCGGTFAATPAYCGGTVVAMTTQRKGQVEYRPDFYFARPAVG
jgi:hypothetical protein